MKEYPVKEPSEDFYFAAAVAEFGLIVRDSAYKGEASFENVRELLGKVDTNEDNAVRRKCACKQGKDFSPARLYGGFIQRAPETDS